MFFCSNGAKNLLEETKETGNEGNLYHAGNNPGSSIYTGGHRQWGSLSADRLRGNAETDGGRMGKTRSRNLAGRTSLQHHARRTDPVRIFPDRGADGGGTGGFSSVARPSLRTGQIRVRVSGRKSCFCRDIRCLHRNVVVLKRRWEAPEGRVFRLRYFFNPKYAELNWNGNGAIDYFHRRNPDFPGQNPV